MTMSVPSSVQVALIQVSSAGNCSVLREKHESEIASIRGRPRCGGHSQGSEDETGLF